MLWVVFCAYAAVNVYLFIRLRTALEGCGPMRVVLCTALSCFALCFPLSAVLDGFAPDWVVDFLFVSASLYMAPMLYAFIFTAAADAVSLLNKVVTITRYPPPYSRSARLSAAFAIFLASVVVTLAGVWNANTPVILEREITLASAPEGFELRAALITDIHLGELTGADYLKKLASMSNERSPDIVLLAGDIFDSPWFLRDDGRATEAASALSSFKSRLGTFAILGNHDHYAGAEKVEKFLADETDVTLLRDRSKKPGGRFLLIGREDRFVLRRGGARKSIREIASDGGDVWDPSRLPVIVMDHQPLGLEEASDAGASLQVSGHTHRGQLFPVNFVVSLIYECSYGLLEKGGATYCVSSGAGTWGPPVRTVGRPEVVIMDIKAPAPAGYDFHDENE
jgi:predicted MPP superfamily phosphohydrolase